MFPRRFTVSERISVTTWRFSGDWSSVLLVWTIILTLFATSCTLSAVICICWKTKFMWTLLLRCTKGMEHVVLAPDTQVHICMMYYLHRAASCQPPTLKLCITLSQYNWEDMTCTYKPHIHPAFLCRLQMKCWHEIQYTRLCICKLPTLGFFYSIMYLHIELKH